MTGETTANVNEWKGIVMPLIKMPNEVSKKFLLKALIYGQPGIGKSTLALSAPNPVLIDCDNGAHRIAPQHRVPFLPVSNYQEVLDVMGNGEVAEYQTIVIDTAGKLLDYMAQWIIDGDPKKGRKDGMLTLQGFGTRKYEFIGLLKKVSTMGKHIIFVAHDHEERNGDDRIVRPDIGGSSGGDLIKELDLVGYMEAVGKQRTISFSPCEKYYAKNSARINDVENIPDLSNGQKNAYMASVIGKCVAVLEEEGEMSKEYEKLMVEIDDVISTVVDAKTANEARAVMGSMTHIWNSKAHAHAVFNKTVSELALAYDAKTDSIKARDNA